MSQLVDRSGMVEDFKRMYKESVEKKLRERISTDLFGTGIRWTDVHPDIVSVNHSNPSTSDPLNMNVTLGLKDGRYIVIFRRDLMMLPDDAARAARIHMTIEQAYRDRPKVGLHIPAYVLDPMPLEPPVSVSLPVLSYPFTPTSTFRDSIVEKYISKQAFMKKVGMPTAYMDEHLVCAHDGREIPKRDCKQHWEELESPLQPLVTNSTPPLNAATPKPNSKPPAPTKPVRSAKSARTRKSRTPRSMERPSASPSHASAKRLSRELKAHWR